MTDLLLLSEWIAKSGKKKGYLAEKCGITKQSFSNKCTGKTDFSVKEIQILCSELGITRLSDKELIFFAH